MASLQIEHEAALASWKTERSDFEQKLADEAAQSVKHKAAATKLFRDLKTLRTSLQEAGIPIPSPTPVPGSSLAPQTSSSIVDAAQVAATPTTASIAALLSSGAPSPNNAKEEHPTIQEPAPSVAPKQEEEIPETKPPQESTATVTPVNLDMVEPGQVVDTTAPMSSATTVQQEVPTAVTSSIPVVEKPTAGEAADSKPATLTDRQAALRAALLAKKGE